MNARWVAEVVCIASVSVRLCAALPQSQDWHARASPAPFNHLRAVATGPQAIVAVGDHGTIVTSPDGLDWTRASFPWDVEFHAVAYGNGMFLAAGRTGTLAIASADGLNWSRWILGSGNSERILYGLTFGIGRFVAVGSLSSDAYPYVLTSPDGRRWESSSRPTQKTLRAVAYVNDTFVAVGDQGTIITSPNAFTWTQRASGTTTTLRAITAIGARFIAAGDGGVVVTSGDGVNWSAAAPLAYGAVGLAASRGALVAVETNDFGNGVVQASPDGLNWPPNFMVNGVSFNAIAADPYGEFVVVGNNGWIFQSETSAMDVVNSWTKPSSGDWQEAFWSRGRLPSNQDDLVAITNAGYKAVAIQSSTTANYAAALTPKNVRLNAPENSHNLLLLNYAGLTVPFSPSGELAVGTNGSLLSYYSAVRADSFSVQGDATFAELAASRFGAVSVTNGGRLLLSNAWLSSGNAEVSGVLSRWDHEVGTHEVAGNLLIGPDSEYRVNNGALSVNGWMQVQPGGQHGVAQFTMSGGTASFGTVALGGRDYMDSDMRGEFILNAGHSSAGNVYVSNGRIVHLGGTNHCDYVEMPFLGTDGSGAYDMYAGRLESGRILLSGDGTGRMYQGGGMHVNSIQMYLFGSDPAKALQHDAIYALVNGCLTSPRIVLGAASFSQTGGTNTVGDLSVNWFGAYYLELGRLVTSYTEVRDRQGNARVLFVHGNAEHVTDYVNLFNGGDYELQDGGLSAGEISVGRDSKFIWFDGVVRSNNAIYLEGGTLMPGARHQQFGSLRVTEKSTIDFLRGPTVVHFADAGYAVNYIDIVNWHGPASSSTRDQLYVGSSAQQGLNPLWFITFINPSGYPTGNYAAQQRANGEIVPLEPGRLACRRSANKLILTWPEGYQLFTSTNVTGPYSPVSGAVSPRDIFCTDPRRFFTVKFGQ